MTNTLKIIRYCQYLIVDTNQEASAVLPSVPQGDPGEDSYATLKPQKSSKKKPVLESVD